MTSTIVIVLLIFAGATYMHKRSGRKVKSISEPVNLKGCFLFVLLFALLPIAFLLYVSIYTPYSEVKELKTWIEYPCTIDWVYKEDIHEGPPPEKLVRYSFVFDDSVK